MISEETFQSAKVGSEVEKLISEEHLEELTAIIREYTKVRRKQISTVGLGDSATAGGRRRAIKVFS